MITRLMLFYIIYLPSFHQLVVTSPDVLYLKVNMWNGTCLKISIIILKKEIHKRSGMWNLKNIQLILFIYFSTVTYFYHYDHMIVWQLLSFLSLVKFWCMFEWHCYLHDNTFLEGFFYWITHDVDHTIIYFCKLQYHVLMRLCLVVIYHMIKNYLCVF